MGLVQTDRRRFPEQDGHKQFLGQAAKPPNRPSCQLDLKSDLGHGCGEVLLAERAPSFALFEEGGVNSESTRVTSQWLMLFQ